MLFNSIEFFRRVEATVFPLLSSSELVRVMSLDGTTRPQLLPPTADSHPHPHSQSSRKPCSAVERMLTNEDDTNWWNYGHLVLFTDGKTTRQSLLSFCLLFVDLKLKILQEGSSSPTFLLCPFNSRCEQ